MSPVGFLSQGWLMERLYLKPLLSRIVTGSAAFSILESTISVWKTHSPKHNYIRTIIGGFGGGGLQPDTGVVDELLTSLINYKYFAFKNSLFHLMIQKKTSSSRDYLTHITLIFSMGFSRGRLKWLQWKCQLAKAKSLWIIYVFVFPS